MMDPVSEVPRTPLSIEASSLAPIIKGIEDRFSSPFEVSQEEIMALYYTLFKGPDPSEAERFLEHRAHPVSIIYALHQVIEHYMSSPSTAKVPTSVGSHAGINGSYFLYGISKSLPLFVFKPTSEETSDLARGIPRGGGSVREHLASVVNEGIFPIPFTIRVNLFGQSGSLQQAVPGKSVSKLMEEDLPKVKSLLPKETLQRKLVFDIIFGNLDGHEGNLLCEGTSLYSIDHGNICSSSIETALYSPYIRFLSSLEPIDGELLAFCAALPITKYRAIMERFGFEDSAIQHMEIRALLLWTAVTRGLTLQEAALPFILQPVYMYSSSTEEAVALFDKIFEFRTILTTLLREEKWEDVHKLLTNITKSSLIGELIKGDGLCSKLWHLYLKPLLSEFPSSTLVSKDIGASIS